MVNVTIDRSARKVGEKLVAVFLTANDSARKLGCVPILALQQAAEPALGPRLFLVGRFQAVLRISEMENIAFADSGLQPNVRYLHSGRHKPSCDVVSNSPLSQPDFLDRCQVSKKQI